MEPFIKKRKERKAHDEKGMYFRGRGTRQS